jgi:bifunctional oligoribonuclease and PAP phosphatase NrnA
VIETAHGRTDAQQVAAALRGAKRVTAICHENPDADTVGAAIAIALIAERLGAAAEVVSVDGLPPSCAFLPLVDRVRAAPALEPDVAVICDAATLERVGRITEEAADWLSRATLVNIDHHATNTGWGALNVVDPNAAATCQIIAELLPMVGVEADEPIATALMAGIVRDSQGFAGAETSPRTLRVVARLMEAGASLALVQRRILYELPFPTMALWGRMLAGVGAVDGARIVYATLTKAMLIETGTQQHDADGLVEFLARAKDAEVTLLLREVGPAETRVSIRAEDGTDATAIAARFGGGGHVRRAGCTVPEPLPIALEKVLAITRASVARG